MDSLAPLVGLDLPLMSFVKSSTASIEPSNNFLGNTMSNVKQILAERSKTHGDFTDNARVMQALKKVVHNELGWTRLNDVQREAVHMILHKVGRIISNPNVHDHWDDIAGYAKLASDRIDVKS